MNRRSLVVLGAGVVAAVTINRWAAGANASAEPRNADAGGSAAGDTHSVLGTDGRWRSHLLPFESFPDAEALGRALASARAQHLFL